MKLKTLIAALAFVAIPAMVSAQTMKENEQTSEQLKHEIDILKADIKALKARQKANKGDTDILAQLGQKKVELKEAKRQKAVFDKAIKADKKAKKETLQAEKAQERLDNATDKRQQ